MTNIEDNGNTIWNTISTTKMPGISTHQKKRVKVKMNYKNLKKQQQNDDYLHSHIQSNESTSHHDDLKLK